MKPAPPVIRMRFTGTPLTLTKFEPHSTQFEGQITVLLKLLQAVTIAPAKGVLCPRPIEFGRHIENLI